MGGNPRKGEVMRETISAATVKRASWIGGALAVFIAAALAFAAVGLGFSSQKAYAADGESMQATMGKDAVISTQAKKSKTRKAKLVKAYKSALKKSGGYQYAIYDINHDGVSELLVNAGQTNSDARWLVYRFKGGKAKACGSFKPGFTTLYAGRGGKLYSAYGHMGVSAFYLISISAGSVRSTVALSDTAELQRFPSASAFMQTQSLKAVSTSTIGKYSLLKKAKA